MAIPTTFAPIKPQDFTLKPIKVNKKFSFTNADLATTASGYYLLDGYYTSLKTPVGDPKANNDPTNDLDGSYKHIIWQSINHRYYKNGYTPFETTEHWNRRWTFKHLDLTASILSIPYLDYGQRIKKESVEIINSDLGITLVDDGYGNLYDSALQTNLSYLSRNNLVGYWGFNDIYTHFKYNYGTLAGEKYQYDAFTYTPDNPSEIRNVQFKAGLEISGSASGLSSYFDGNGGFIMSPNRDSWNYDSEDQFLISFWIKPENTGSGAVISKRGVEFKAQLGYLDKVLDSGQVTKDRYISSSYVDSSIDAYPYDFTYSGSNLYFKRSDGIRSLTLSGSTPLNSWSHVSAIRYSVSGSSKCALFINGQFQGETTDPTVHPMNKKALMFGAANQAGNEPFTGYLDEVRFYNSSFYTGSNISGSLFHADLATSSYAYNTSVVGNVFYRQGNIVLSPLDPRYKDMLSGSYTVNYRGTHTIYQYEILSRIRKGDFNLTLNPTALKSPKSDLLINEMTGSLLKPYFTTIGYYNDRGTLLAVAKMGQPVQVRDDVDINVIARMDI